MTDEYAEIRLVFAQRTDFTPTPAQFERGLADEYVGVREVFMERQAEWAAKWEAQELRKRHASTTQAHRPKVEAL